MPSKKKEEVTESTSGTQPANVAMTEEEAKTASSPQPGLVISSIDRSLINAQGPLLTRAQINDVRRKLKAKFH